MEIFTLLDTLEDLLEEGRGIPFSSKVIVDQEQMIDIIKEIRIKLPDELKQAKWINTIKNRTTSIVSFITLLALTFLFTLKLVCGIFSDGI